MSPTAHQYRLHQCAVDEIKYAKISHLHKRTKKPTSVTDTFEDTFLKFLQVHSSVIAPYKSFTLIKKIFLKIKIFPLFVQNFIVLE